MPCMRLLPTPPSPDEPNFAAILALASSLNRVCRATYCCSVSPGSRSIPLASALDAADAAPPWYPTEGGAERGVVMGLGSSVGSGRPSTRALRTSL